MIATCRGDFDIFIHMLKNKTIDLNCYDSVTHINCFWLAAYFGHGDIIEFLGNKDINVLCKHKTTLSNALHIAIQRKHYAVAS